MRKLIAFLRLSRPIHLLDGLIVFALGAFVARYKGYNLNFQIYIIGQIFITSLQLMTHYLNEYWDIETDRLNRSRTFFSGGSGVLPDGDISRETAFIAFLISLGVASTTATILIFQYGCGPIIWTLMSLIFLGSFFYSNPPIILASSGYGELTTAIIIAGLVPAFSYLIQSTQTSWFFLLAIVPLIPLHYAAHLAVEFPDFLSDEATGKKTLLVRLGRRQGASLHNVLIVISLGLAAIESFLGLPSQVAISFVITAPIAVWQIMTIRRMRRGEPISFHRLTLGAVILFALTAYLMAFSFWVIG